MNIISPNLNIMIKACEKAFKNNNQRFWGIRKFTSSVKGPRDFVTNSDKKVEKILIEELSKSKKIIPSLQKKQV